MTARQGTPRHTRKVFTGLSAISRYGQRVSAQRARPAVAADHRSIHPNIPGVPWWAAVVIATTATAVGFAFDASSGHKELTNVFAALYVVGCAVAVLAVRQSGVFTAVIQPPLILFCAVPGAYWQFHSSKIGGVKDILINCGYPLIERFPLMLFTAAGVLLVGMIRWYLAMAAHTGATATTNTDTTDAPKGRIGAKLAALRNRDAGAGEAAPKAPRRAHAVGRDPKAAKPARSARPTKRPAPTRARQARPPLDDEPESSVQRARRQAARSARDGDPGTEPPRRRPRPRDPDLRGQPPREIRRDPHLRSGRPTTRSSRFDPYEPIDPYDLPSPRRRPAPEGVTGSNGTHHPISRVRYRESGRSRGSPNSAAESWEYDI